MAKKTLDDAYTQFLRTQVESAGAKYVGVQECEGWLYDLVLFNHRGTTLAVKSNVNDIKEAVRKRLEKYERDYD